MIELSKLEEWEEWVPTSERELFERDPETATTMELKFLNKEKRDHYQRLAKKYKSQGLVSSADTRATRDLFADHVRNIRNMTIAGVEIIDGGQLFDIEGFDLVQLEVVNALMQRSSLEEGLAKKLRLASASTSLHRTDNATGGAAVVTPPSLRTIPEETTRPGISDSQTPSSAPSAAVIGSRNQSSTNGRHR